MILPYANLSAEQLVQAGQTDLGISYPPDVIINDAKGFGYRAVGALVSENTTALAVLASSKYTRPAQLSGKVYGGFGIASDEPLVTAIMHADGVAHPVFKQVVLGTDVITALAAHRVDYTAVFDGIDDVTAALQGIKLRTFPYRRYLGAAGDYPNAVYVASDRDIAARGPILARALKALARGLRVRRAPRRRRADPDRRQPHRARERERDDHRGDRQRDRAALPRPAGVWGPETDADYAGLERILATAPPDQALAGARARSTRTRCCRRVDEARRARARLAAGGRARRRSCSSGTSSPTPSTRASRSPGPGSS